MENHRSVLAYKRQLGKVFREHSEVDDFRVEVPLKLERELVEIVALHQRLVRSRCEEVRLVGRGVELGRRDGEFQVLRHTDQSTMPLQFQFQFWFFLSLSLSFNSALLKEREGGRGENKNPQSSTTYLQERHAPDVLLVLSQRSLALFSQPLRHGLVRRDVVHLDAIELLDAHEHEAEAEMRIESTITARSDDLVHLKEREGV